MPELIAAESEPIPAKKAAVIDDAFDDVAEGEILLQDFTEFYQEVQDIIEPVLERLQIPNPDINEWDDNSIEYLSYLKQLWEKKTDVELAAIIRSPKLFAVKMAKLDELNKVCENLKAQNFEVQQFDSDFLQKGSLEGVDFVYIFIDYNLGVHNGPEAVLHAKDVIGKIYKAYPENKKPVTVLMSSLPNINDLAEGFKKDSGMLEGVFRSAPKADLSDKDKISLLAKAYDEAFYCNHALQGYIESLITAAAEAQDVFQKEVRTLNVEDYEFIQNSVLNDEQHPLGDYLAWLYGSHWTSLLQKNKALKAKQVVIDKVISTNTPLYSKKPSEKLAEIFMSALFEDDLGNLGLHPLQGISPAVLKLPYLHLGDLFSKTTSKKVFMVLNPQCDLERPRLETKETSILLLPGHLELLESSTKSAGAKTDFFIFEGQRYRILWELKQVITVPYNEISKWLKGKKLERHFRLRLPFALELQQKFTSNMSRVGLPVAPPMTENIALKVYYKRFEDVMDFIPESDQYAFLPITRNNKGEKVRLTLDFALSFKGALLHEIQILKDIAAVKGEKPKKLGDAIKKIGNFIEEFDDWFFKTRGFTKPGTDNVIALKANLISVISNTNNLDNVKTSFWIVIKNREEIKLMMPSQKSETLDNKIKASKGRKTRATKAPKNRRKVLKKINKTGLPQTHD